MESKAPVLLTVLVETGQGRWYTAGVDLDSTSIPLVRSESGNLDAYHHVAFDDQVSFLRHRLSGVLQIACDRLWGKSKKPCQIVFVTDACFQQAPAELTQRVADHFVEWMTSPPVAFFVSEQAFTADAPLSLKQLAGQISPEHQQSLLAGLPRLFAEMREASRWESAPVKNRQSD